MIRDQKSRLTKDEASRPLKFRTIKERCPEDVFEPRRSDVKNASGFLSKLNDAPPVRLCRHEVEMSHFCNAMSDCLVKRPFRCLSTVYMDDRNLGHERCLSCGKYLKTISENDQDVRLHAGISFCEPNNAEPDRLCYPYRCVTRQQHLNSLSNWESIRFYLTDGHPELWRKMHARHCELKLERIIGFDLAKEPVEQSIFCSSASNYTNLTLRHHFLLVKHYLECLTDDAQYSPQQTDPFEDMHRTSEACS